MSDERWLMEDNYTLFDSERGRRYSTGVTLADCGIPFVDLLNRESNYARFHKENYEKEKEENRKLKKQISEFEELHRRFEEMYDSPVEEMVRDFE